MMIYFTADTHFGHANIIKYCNRPFKSIKEMDKVLINNWNKIIKKKDTVYHLGDFAFDIEKYAKQLNGSIYLVAGGHDRFKTEDFGWILICPKIEIIKYHHINIVMCHYPLETWHGSNYGSIHLHGHSHGKLRKIPNRIDVGVDCWNYKPVKITEIIKK
jgi:calcineurin-like phosphoesterase family protein